MASRLELLDVTKALQELTKALGELSLSIAQTRELAFNLGVGLQQLDDVDLERRGTERTKYYMQAWLNNQNGASWEQIIRALNSMRLNRQAAQLRDMISSPQFSSMSQTDQPTQVPTVVHSNPPTTSASTGNFTMSLSSV